MSFLTSFIGGLTSSYQFPYNVGAVVQSYVGRSIWTLYNGTKKEDGAQVSIFGFDIKKNQSKLDIARNGFKRAKTIRHPNFITYLDGVETDSFIYIVTESITPLEDVINDIKKFENSISWGIYQITKALSFINNDCNLTHGNVMLSSIFVNKGGDWKLGGLELVCDIRDSSPFLKIHGDQVPAKYKTPEVLKAQWSQLNQAPPYAIDSWMLGCLIFECFNGPMTKADDVRDLSTLPKALHQSFQKCFSIKLESRLNPLKFLESPFFQNIFVETCVFLENITLKDNFEKEAFFKKLDQHIDKLPPNICKFKILPHLITAFEIGPINTKLLGTLLKISSNLSTDEYTAKVIPSVVKWFASDDRSLRINLLENLEHYIQHLSPAIVNDAIFPNLVNGFNDKPALKELTIKSMLLFAPKLSEKTMIQLLKYFAALQKDMEPGIRTNTTICLGRITEYISDQTRKRVLIPAFSTALKDPFVPSQNAGISAFLFTIGYYTPEEIATRVIPELSRMLIAPDKQVRTNTFQAINVFLKKLETYSVELEQQQQKSPTSNQSPGVNNNTGSFGGSGDQSQQQQQDSMFSWAVDITKKYIVNVSTDPSALPNNQNNNIGGKMNNSISNTSPVTNSGSGNSSYNKPIPSTQYKQPIQPKNNGWDDEDEEEEEEEEEKPEKKVVEKFQKNSISSTKPSSVSNQSTISTSSTKSGGMQLVSKKQQPPQTNKLSSFSFDGDGSDSDSNNNNNSGWDDDYVMDEKPNKKSTNINNKITNTKTSNTKPVTSPISSDGWDDWND